VTPRTGFLAVVAAAGVAATLGAQAPPQPPAPMQAQQAPVFRATASGVSVSVSVRSGGTPVPNLTAADFELVDNGVPQTISAVTLESLPIDVSLILDVSASVEGRRLDRMKQAVTETSTLLGAADQLRLLAVQHALLQVFPFQPGGTTPPIEQLRAHGGTALLDGLSAALMRAAEPDRRQLIVVYTDGHDTISVLPAATVRTLAGIADAVVHFVVPNAGRSRTETMGTLIDLAARTGGQVFRVELNAPIAGAFREAVEEFRTSYVLRYTPTGVTSGGWHELAVRVKSGTYTVRARRGYEG
jgi:VWFA-related protein